MTAKEELFLKNFSDFKKSLEWLKRALSKAEGIDLGKPLSEEELERVELLFSRFSRSVDFLISKILRGIDLLELEEVGTKLDVAIRAEKRGFVEDYRRLIALKDLRNELAHEYLGERFVLRLPEVVEGAKELLFISDRVINYVERELLPKLGLK